MVRRQLTRSLVNKRIAGVCGGLGEHMDADPVVIRLLWVLLTLALLPVGILGYLIAWLMIPKVHPVAYAYPPTPAMPVTQQT